MGLGGCYSIIKFLLVVFNFIFWVLGIVGVIFGIWMLVDPTFTVSLTQEATDYTISVVIILIGSALLVIVAGLGMYGALKERQCALLIFFSLLLIIFVAEISTGLWAYMNSDSLMAYVRSAVKLTVEQEYGQDDSRRELFDTFQRNLECCGADKPTDWIGNREVIVSITPEPTTFNIPQSCCRVGVAEADCLLATRNLKITNGINYNIVHSKGCSPAIVDHLKEYARIIMGIGIAVAVIQFLGLVFSLVLAFAVSRYNRYKS